MLAKHTVSHRVQAIRGTSVPTEDRERRRTSAVDFRQGVRMHAQILEKPAAFQIDGEDCGEVTEFSAVIKNRGLKVRVAN